MYFMNSKIEKLANFVFPSALYCLSCGKMIDRFSIYGICSTCMGRIDWGKIYIPRKSLEKSIMNGLYLDDVIACARYGTLTRAIVEEYKNNERTYIARTMAQLMWERIATDENALDYLNCDMIVPAPISKGSKRSFNQSEKLAKHLGENTGQEVRDILIKEGTGKSQKKLTALERRIEIQDSIDVAERVREKIKMEGKEEIKDEINEKANRKIKDETNGIGNGEVKGGLKDTLKGKKILLIDDVLTTGVTANECAKALKQNGAEKVYCLVFATGNQGTKKR